MYTLKSFLLLLLATVILTGCVTTTQTAPDVVLPPMLDMSEDDLLPDQKLVLGSLIERMRGNGPLEMVSFDANGVQASVEKDFKYEGFNLAGLLITGYDVKQISSNSASVYFDGGLLLKDGLERRVAVQFALNYVISNDRIVIQNSAITQRTPSFPNVQAFILPGSFEDIPAERVKTMSDLYIWTVIHAVPMNVTDRESFSNQKYSILVFCMDRLRKEAAFDVVVTRSAYGGQPIGEMVYIGDRGWRTGLLVSEFTPDSPRSQFYIRAKYNPDPKGDGQDILVGVFANKRAETTQVN